MVSTLRYISFTTDFAWLNFDGTVNCGARLSCLSVREVVAIPWRYLVLRMVGAATLLVRETVGGRL